MFPNSIGYHCKERDSQNKFVKVGNTVANYSRNGWVSDQFIISWPGISQKKSIWKCDKTKTNLWPTLSSLRMADEMVQSFPITYSSQKAKVGEVQYDQRRPNEASLTIAAYRCVVDFCKSMHPENMHAILRVQGSLNFYCKRTLKNLYCKKGGQTRIIKK